ncbi:hypothetical protein MMC14_000667 [Varicellaria rhodocarpa]|nr:hypothetical protein [Varicellaria rhodocarpa]
MPTYAILGATGATGSSLLTLLLPLPNTHLNLYARSPARLHAMHPTLSSNPSNVSIYTGAFSDTALLASCLRGVDVIFSVVAQNSNEPECSIAVRVTKGVVETLELLKKENDEGEGWKCPKVVFLSSQSLNARASKEIPKPMLWLLHQAAWYIYKDLEQAIEYLRSFPWIPLILAEPGGLLNEAPNEKGVRVSEDESSGFISYVDLAKGMVLMAEEGNGERWIGKEVGIVVGQEPAVWKRMALARHLLPGLLASWIPGLWRMGTRLGAW